jgi:hypothetical protein
MIMTYFEKLSQHVGHNIACVQYGHVNVSIECEDCHEVLVDSDVLDENIESSHEEPTLGYQYEIAETANGYLLAIYNNQGHVHFSTTVSEKVYNMSDEEQQKYIEETFSDVLETL